MVEEIILNNKPFEIRKASATIEGATKYNSYEEALAVIREHELHGFNVYPVCPRCHKDYDGHHAISRKNNKTKIFPNCGTGEALINFMDNIQKKELPIKVAFIYF